MISFLLLGTAIARAELFTEFLSTFPPRKAVYIPLSTTRGPDSDAPPNASRDSDRVGWPRPRPIDSDTCRRPSTAALDKGLDQKYFKQHDYILIRFYHTFV